MRTCARICSLGLPGRQYAHRPTLSLGLPERQYTNTELQIKTNSGSLDAKNLSRNKWRQQSRLRFARQKTCTSNQEWKADFWSHEQDLSMKKSQNRKNYHGCGNESDWLFTSCDRIQQLFR